MTPTQTKISAMVGCCEKKKHMPKGMNILGFVEWCPSDISSTCLNTVACVYRQAFSEMTVLKNLMLALHEHHQYFCSVIFYSRTVFFYFPHTVYWSSKIFTNFKCKEFPGIDRPLLAADYGQTCSQANVTIKKFKFACYVIMYGSTTGTQHSSTSTSTNLNKLRVALLVRTLTL